ncbi:hypothetical protein PFICI_12600 [Pestalotiopsis fici W106-1]|uniref:WW domain-containing protein n=1 Tax=Pestalotiopsis fici (strain W106-1 / CGMCC3.15140) TaxID=1229662 RepID=W3WS48_PESFW|nr:uncharacterized protein PFICI_12600 [Pestalotiopsis fici W106-1]ETS75656.1 hypothetical protein PFICI_12600 [Pestalotiopsis fici W106-1]
MASSKSSSKSPTREAGPSSDPPHEPAITAEHAEEPQDNDAAVTTTAIAAQSPDDENDDGASLESGEASPVSTPAKPTKNADEEAPPLPNEPPPAQEDDGWEFHWDEANQAYYFHNRVTGQSTWENPRISKEAGPAGGEASAAGAESVAEPPKNEKPPAGGYNPAIHGDYDPNAWYAQSNDEPAEQSQSVDPAAAYAAIGSFNRFTGRWQGGDQDPDQHNDENKSRRQMNAFFDVDAAANAHDGRSLKAERSGKKPSKNELKQFKEKRRAKKEEKRRAWLRD